MAEDKNKQTMTIEVTADESVSQGRYINMARILHNQHEFVLDAMFLMLQTQKAKVASRLIMTPAHAKHLLNALAQNIELYERKYGPISMNGTVPTVESENFN